MLVVLTGKLRFGKTVIRTFYDSSPPLSVMVACVAPSQFQGCEWW